VGEHIKPTRRGFFGWALGAAVGAVGEGVAATRSHLVTDFQNSYLHCQPTGTGIWVRVSLECIAEAFDVASGRTDRYFLSVKAQTGLGETGTSGRLYPGYEYWMIFAKDRVLMKRLHTSSYLNNPSVVPSTEFGPHAAHLQTRSARRLTSHAEIASALRGWRTLTARTTFLSRDRKTAYRVEYPVKWADINDERKAFRVETGPVLLLDADKIEVGVCPQFEDFKWAHLDYHSFDSVRCLIERPTDILQDATYQPPAATPRQTAAITREQVEEIRRRLWQSGPPPLAGEALHRLLQTDRYSDAVNLPCSTELYALKG